MRSFQFITLIIFIIFYIIITVGTYTALKKLTLKKKHKKLNILYWGYSLLLLFLFVFFYIYPNSPREASNYTFYFYLNAILFIDFFFKLPLNFFLIISLLLKRNRIPVYCGLLISTGLGLVLLYGFLQGNNESKIVQKELEYAELPNDFNNFKIIQISDIHLGSIRKSNRVLNKTEKEILAEQPDLILFTGDLVNNFSNETLGWTNLFRRINTESKSYSILGNHDYGDYASWDEQLEKEANFNNIVNAHKELGFRLLRNEHEIIYAGNDSIYLLGVENWGHPPFPQYANLEQAFLNVPENSFKILMTHDPAHWETKIKGKEDIQLSLSGHTHGLQWGIKFAGIPFSLAYLTRETWGGLYQHGNTKLYVNTGLGTVGIPWRIDMPAEITVITLKRSKVD